MKTSTHLVSPLTGRTACPAETGQATKDPGLATCEDCKSALSSIVGQLGNTWQVPGAHRRGGYTWRDMRNAYSAGLLRNHATGNPPLAAPDVTLLPGSAEEVADLVKRMGLLEEALEIVIEGSTTMAKAGVKQNGRIKALEDWARAATVEHVPGTAIPDFPLSATETAQNSAPTPEVPEAEKVAQWRARGADGAYVSWREGVPRWYQVGDVVTVRVGDAPIGPSLAVIVAAAVGSTFEVRSLDGLAGRMVSVDDIRLATVYAGTDGVYVQK